MNLSDRERMNDRCFEWSQNCHTWINHAKIVQQSTKSKLSKIEDEWRDEKRKKNKKKSDELKSLKHRSLHVFYWTRHRTRDKQTWLIDKIVIRRSTIDCRYRWDTWWDIWRDFLISDDIIPDRIFFSQELKKRKVDAIIWNDMHE